MYHDLIVGNLILSSIETGKYKTIQNNTILNLARTS